MRVFLTIHFVQFNPIFNILQPPDFRPITLRPSSSSLNPFDRPTRTTVDGPPVIP